MSLDPAQIPHITARSASDIAKASGSSFLASFRFLRPDQRVAFNAVYAFFRIADDCVDELATPALKRQALSYWRSELGAVYHGTPLHPVMRELRDAVARFSLPEEHFTGLISGCEMDIEKSRYETFAELKEYCRLVAGLVGLVCMKIFEYESPTVEQTALATGLAFQLTNIVRDVGADLDLGRIYIPQETMRQHGYSEAALLSREESPAFFRVMEFLHDEAEKNYALAAPELLNDKSGKLMATLAMTRVYHAVLAKIRRKNYPVFRKKVSLNPFEKARLILPLFARAWL